MGATAHSAEEMLAFSMPGSMPGVLGSGSRLNKGTSKEEECPEEEGRQAEGKRSQWGRPRGRRRQNQVLGNFVQSTS
jgi:hypothetical protein